MKKDVTKLKSLSIVELDKESQKVRLEMSRVKLEWNVNKPKDSNVLSKKKRYLAQILTVQTQKRYEESVENLKK